MTSTAQALTSKEEQALDDMAQRIRSAHANAAESFKSGVEHAAYAGSLLLMAKEHIPHGQWLPWLADQCSISERTAQAYMRVARRWKENPQSIADLTFGQAMKLLAQPRDKAEPVFDPGDVHVIEVSATAPDEMQIIEAPQAGQEDSAPYSRQPSYSSSWTIMDRQTADAIIGRSLRAAPWASVEALLEFGMEENMTVKTLLRLCREWRRDTGRT